MKPRLLKIKGLNSFIDQQVIDFETLMEHGLFGIFGPTGSGKSTILDAITLALYGEIPRCSGKKLAGIINTQADSAYVYFEFELGTASRRRVYSVERLVKKTKTGGTSSEAIVCDITHKPNKEVLGDKVTTTNQVLRDIIGLNAGDFMKSVVLPQGSFSEFLQLEGKPRREMLERIFGLEEYGDILSDKATAYQRRKNEQMQRLEGQLSSYEDIDKEKLEELNQRKKQLSEDVKNIQGMYNQALKNLESYRDIWNLTQELQKATKEYEDKLAQKDLFTSKEDRLDRSKKASNVKPFIDRLQNIENTLATTEKSKQRLDQELHSLSQVIAELELKWKEAMDKKDNTLPKLIIARENLSRGVKLFEEGQNLHMQRTKLEGQVEDIDTKLIEYAKKGQRIQRLLESLSRELEDLKTEEQKHIISPLHRQNIQKGYEVEKEYNRLKGEQDQLDKRIKLYKNEIEQNQKDYDVIFEKYKAQQTIINDLLDRKKKLDESCPGDRDNLLDRQQQLSNLKEQLKRAEQMAQETGRIHDKILQLSQRSQEFEKQIEKDRTEYQQKTAILERLEKELAQAETHNMAAVLAKDLQHGMACPVCGSKDHPMPAHSMEHTQKIDALKHEISVAKDELSDLQGRLATKAANLSSLKEQIEEEKAKLSEISHSTEDADIEQRRKELERLESEFMQFRADLDSWDREIKECNREIENTNALLSDLRQRETELKTTLRNNSSLLKENEELYNTNSIKLEETLKAYKAMQSETNIDSFHEAVQRIQESDKKLEDIRQQMKDKTNAMERDKKALEELTNEINKNKVDLATLKEQIRHMDRDITRLKEEVNQLTGGENPNEKLKETEAEILQINDEWKKVSQNWDEQNKRKDELNKEYSAVLEKHLLLSKQHKEEAQALDGMLAENGFVDRETALECLLPPEETKKLDVEIKEYYSQLSILEDRIRTTQDRLQGESIDEEKWNFIQSEEERLKTELETRKEELLMVDMSIDSMGEKLAQKLQLLSKKQDLIKQLNHINQLMSLLRGKRFVDFVAKRQLQQIARSASLRLKDITRGRYALELDGEGNFIIRDDFNGGARRPTHTLSGGETFVTSLSLALALSSRIQMGKASLDFFFLDEGFGTLDADLLDVVIGSLEQLRNNRMCVGLISHVDELKQRIPRKLMVNPAISGERGTTVVMD